MYVGSIPTLANKSLTWRKIMKEFAIFYFDYGWIIGTAFMGFFGIYCGKQQNLPLLIMGISIYCLLAGGLLYVKYF